MPAVVVLDYDPVLRLGDRIVRLDTLVIAVVLLAVFVLAARIAAGTPAGTGSPPMAGERLRVDDGVFILLAVIPGAVAGGRLGYVLLHLDYYGANPAAVLDPGQGSLQLGLGILGGALTGAYAARLLDQPVRRWLHVAALPMLLAAAGGKVAQVVGGGGQGAPGNVAWATSYAGPGPWGSLAPSVPAHPSQLYEAVLTAAVAIGLVGLLAAGAFRRRDGTLFGAALAGWAAVRLAVATTWRDPAVLGPLRADQLLSIGILVTGLAVMILAPRWVGGASTADARLAEPQWPDPQTRPRF